LIAEGYSNAEIAEHLGISPRTVKAHSDALRTKLRVSRRRQIPAAFRELTGEDPHALEGLGSERDANGASRVSR
jgi:predicted transcriptional regulator